MQQKLEQGFFGFWVKNFRVSFLFIFLIILSGIFSLISIPKESSPDIKFGIIGITTVYPGVNPEDIDSLITDEIEKEIKDIDGIKSIDSTSSVGVSSVSVELFNGVDTRDVMTDIKDKIDGISFPEDAEDPNVIEISTSNELMFQLLIYGPKDTFSNFFLNSKAQEMKSALEGKGGISSIDLGGLSSTRADASSSSIDDYDIEVLISRDKIQELGLSLRDISSQIRSFNKNTPIGNYTIGDLSYDFRFQGEFNSVDELKNLTIIGSDNSLLKLSDIAQIKTVYPGDNIYSLVFSGETGYNYVSLDFNKKEGSNIFVNSASAKRLIESYVADNALGFSGLQIEYTKDAGDVIKEDYKSLSRTAVQTLILVFIVIFIFVGMRESLIASILLPLSFLITFIVLDTLGLSLNFLTNFSLVLTLGIAIDTIIIIIEGASERLKIGYNRGSAVLLAMKDLKAPLISGTMTTLVAFLPMMFLPGITGKFLSYIPITVFATLLAALLLSLTVSSALFLKLTKKYTTFQTEPSFEKSLSSDEKNFLVEQRSGKTQLTNQTLGLRGRFLEALGSFYFKILHSFLSHKKERLLAIITPIILLFLTFFFLAPRIGFTLFPAGDNAVLDINVSGPTGSKEEVLEQYLPRVEEKISAYPELEIANITLSGNEMGIYIELTNKNDRERNVFDIESSMLADLQFLVSDGFEMEAQAQEGGPPTGKPVGVKLIASNTKSVPDLKRVSKDFEAFLRDIPGTKNITSSSSDTPGQFVFLFDNNKLNYFGLNPDDFLNEIYFYTNGLKAGSIKSEFEDNDIVLKVAEFEEDLSPSDIENLVIQTRVGKFRVGDFASYELTSGLSSISREDRKITISVESDLELDTLPSEVQPQLITFAESYNYPAGISFSSGGENTENAELIQSTLQSFFIAIFLIFTILVFQFNSFSRPLIILYSVVLALLGVNIGLFFTGNPYSMSFAIGFIALTGIVVNDAIIFVDRMMKNIAKLEEFTNGTPTQESYLDAVSAAGKTRLQPIIVTTLTTIFGVLPLALQDEFWAGLGFTVIFGLLVGSSMTLFIIPALYYQLYVVRKCKQWK
ncbi:efflux RND transporter permease subunit [Candidatus Gracilibacteria bacterium]|nr:efflux RND transporter permease subunit [Candidatus Gracilibacteria bacterium]